MTMMYSGAAPCVSCGTEGGDTQRGGKRPLRRHGLCGRCYNREHRTGHLRTARACLACGKARGIYGRELCGVCAARARAQGLYHRYPECGAVAVPYQGPHRGTPPEHPEPPPMLSPQEFGTYLLDCADPQAAHVAPWGRVPFGAPPEVLPARWQGCPPRLASAPTATLNPDAHRRIVQAERDAAAWLAERGREAA